MTADEIRATSAGRELDALVAERVMGWAWWRSDATGRRAIFPQSPRPSWFTERADCTEALARDWDTMLSRYSTDIAAAWEVAERLPGLQINKLATGWMAIISEGTRFEKMTTAPTAPHAICLAALLRALETQ